MPAQFTLPPDTRAVGTGNPPGDMNSVVDALTAMGAVYNVCNAAYAGGADPSGVSDSTAAFQACITAATTARAEVIIPAGSYNLNTAGLNFTGGVKLRGLGAAMSSQTITPNPGVVLNCNGGAGGTQHLFNFPSTGQLWGGLEMENFSVSYTGTGNVFNRMSIMDSVFRDMNITLTAAGSMAIFCSGTDSYFNVLHERCNFVTTAPVRSSPVISVNSSTGGAISDNTFFRCKFFNNGLDSTQFQVAFACTGAGSLYHYNDNFIECWFEHPWGGAYQSLSGQGIAIQDCTVWDIFSGPSATVAAGSNGGTISGIAAWANPSPGVLAATGITSGFPPAGGTLNVVTSGTTGVITYTGYNQGAGQFTGCAYVSGSGTVSTGAAITYPVSVGNSSYYFGAYPGNSGNQGVRVTSCTRNLNGPNGSTTWDIECDALTSQVQVEGFTVKPLNASTYTPAYFNFHGCNDVLLLNNVSPQGAAVNGNSNVVVTNPSPTQLAISQGVITPAPMCGTFTPSDCGYVAWTYDPVLATSAGAALTTGTVYLVRVNIKTTAVVTNIVCDVTVLGATLTASQNWLALYSSTGTLIGQSTDQSGVWTSTGIKTAALTGGPFTLAPGFYWVMFLSNGTTPPGMLRAANFSSVSANAGFTTGTARVAQNGTGTVPPSPLVVGSNTLGQLSLWAALS